MPHAPERGSIQTRVYPEKITGEPNPLKNKFWILCVALTGLALAGCGQKGSEQLVTVNGDTLNTDDYTSAMSVKNTARVILNGEVAELPLAETPGFQTLQELVIRQIVLQLAKDAGVYPTDADIDKEIEFRKKVNSTFMRELNARGMTVAQIKENVKIELARERLVTRGVNVTKEDVDNFIKDDPAQFTEPARAELLWMLIRDENRKNQADAELRGGQSFGPVAVKYTDYNPAQGGQKERYPIDVIAQMPPELQKIVTELNEGQTSGWIRTGEGSAKFMVERKYPSRPRQLDETQREVVRRNLALSRGNAATDLNRRIAEKLKEAKVTVSKEELKTPWQNSEKRFREEYDKLTQGAAAAGTESTSELPKTGAASAPPPEGN